MTAMEATSEEVSYLYHPSLSHLLLFITGSPEAERS